MQPIALDQVKQIELDILRDIDAFCRKCNLRYQLNSGTLLGAIRHRGFIPWDDDIDIAMPREDYERFFVEYPLHSSGKFKLLSHRDKSSIYPFFKVVDPRTVVFEKYVNPRYQTGVWVDIFPLDLLPANDRPFKTCNRYQMLYALATANPETATSATRKLIKKLTTPLFERIDIYAAAAKMDKIARNAGDEACTDRGMLLFGYGPRERQPSSVLDSIEVEFEGEPFFAPRDYDAYLTSLYDDYMTLPPVEKRTAHDFEAYWRLDGRA